jgi:aryl-alcohol dehydrogenase-like predicted oxidoreductase
VPLDHYVTLGRSGLRVSPFALGAMTFGEDPGAAGSSVEESEKILATYLDRGGNFVDTANFYTNGHSEAILGDFLAAHPGRRERVVLASKFFTNMFAGDPNGGGAGRRSIVAQLDQTLRRLRTDYLDLYWLHNWDRNTPIEETMRALDDVVRAGKVRYLGFSNVPAWVTAQAQTLAQLRGWTPLIALQVEYSLLARTVEGEIAPLALDQGMALVPWSPLKNGFLSGKYRRGVEVTDSARTPTSWVRRRRRWRWRGCGPGPARSCRSSAPGGWSSSWTTSPAWTWPSRPTNSGGWTTCRRRAWTTRPRCTARCGQCCSSPGRRSTGRRPVCTRRCCRARGGTSAGGPCCATPGRTSRRHGRAGRSPG